MKYRKLRNGEIIRKGDQWLSEMSVTWNDTCHTIGQKLKVGTFNSNEYRRPIRNKTRRAMPNKGLT